jgi:hypothetical protein
MNKISAPIANGTPMRRPDNLDAHSPGAQAMRLSSSDRSKRIGPRNRPKESTQANRPDLGRWLARRPGVSCDLAADSDGEKI